MEFKERFSTCSKDCYGACVFKGFWDDKDQEKKFQYGMPLKSHPFTKGFFCPKLNKRKNLLYHPKRIKTPLIRSGPKGTQTFKEASYNGILNIINQKVNEVKKHFDFNCILAAFYSGNSGLISMYGPLRLFYQIKGTITKGGICNEGGIAGLSEIFGTYSITNPFQISSPETRLIVNWAANVSSNNNHVNFLIKNKIKQNTPLIVIDSRKISIAKYADLFLQPFPNSDHLLAKIVLYKLIKNEILDHKFLEKYVEGYENLINEVLSINPSELIPLIGVKEKEIDQFVGMLSASKSHTIFNIGYGLQKHKYGGRIIQIVSLIQIFLGNIGKPGSGIIYSQSGFNKPIKEPIINYIIQKSKSSSVKEFELINLTSELKKEKYKILFIYNFNPVSSLPNQDDLRKALCQKGLFTVVLDLFLNETTKYADIVIPVKFDLEASDLVFSYYIPGVSIIEGGPCPYENCRSNYDFFRDLAIKMNLNKDGLFNEDHYQLYKNTLKKLPEPIRKKLEEEGYYLLHKNDTILFEDLQFPTLSKKIQLTDITFDFETEIINYLNKREPNEFFLITPSYKYFLHSQLREIYPEKLEIFSNVYINSKDINNLTLKSGQKVIVKNNRYSANYNLMVDNSLKQGIACIYSGPSSQISGINVNFFTPSQPEILGFSGSYNSAKIKIEKSN